jgi:hypothetical protein
MAWPEKDLVTRLLAAIVGGPLGAWLGFLLAAGPFRSLGNGHPPILAFVLGATAIASIASFWLGDPAVRFLLRLMGGGPPIGGGRPPAA